MNNVLKYLKLKISYPDFLDNYLSKQNLKKIMIYGCGKMAEILISDLKKIQIIAFVDKNFEFDYFENIRVLKQIEDYGMEEEDITVLISILHLKAEEIRKELLIKYTKLKVLLLNEIIDNPIDFIMKIKIFISPLFNCALKKIKYSLLIISKLSGIEFELSGLEEAQIVYIKEKYDSTINSKNKLMVKTVDSEDWEEECRYNKIDNMQIYYSGDSIPEYLYKNNIIGFDFFFNLYAIIMGFYEKKILRNEWGRLIFKGSEYDNDGCLNIQPLNIYIDFFLNCIIDALNVKIDKTKIISWKNNNLYLKSGRLLD